MLGSVVFGLAMILNNFLPHSAHLCFFYQSGSRMLQTGMDDNDDDVDDDEGKVNEKDGKRGRQSVGKYRNIQRIHYTINAGDVCGIKSGWLNGWIWPVEQAGWWKLEEK